MRQRHRQTAFTLVELTLAVTLTALVTGSTVAILRTTAAAKLRVNEQMAVQAEARLAVNTIATALRNASLLERQNAATPDGYQGGLEGIDDWSGQMPADRVRFFSLSLRRIRHEQPESDVRQCEFAIDQMDEQAPPALLRRTDPTRNDPPDAGGVVEMIAENVVGLNVTYHDGLTWLDEWTVRQQQSWPLAVRIELAVLSGQQREAGRPGLAPQIWTTSRIVNFPALRQPPAAESEQ